MSNRTGANLSSHSNEPDPSRRDVLVGTTAVAAGIAVSTLFPQALHAEPTPATAPSTDLPLSLKINGQQHTLALDARVSLLDALREHLDITGTKKGCDHGQCGACTVLIDDRRVLSCLTLAATCNGKSITTIEGLADGDTLHPVQQAFIEHDAFQCGYCTPGQICSAVGLIKENRCKTDEDIRVQMSGNICRCGAYPNIVTAVKQAMQAKA